MNDGAGSYSYHSRHALPWGNGTPWIPERVVLGDIDGDADLDAVVGAAHDSYYLEMNVVPMFNTGRLLEPGPMMRFGAANSVDALDVRDLNLDGRLDIVAMGNQFPERGRIWVIPGMGGGRFAAPVLHYTPVIGRGLDIADVSGDGQWDILIAGGHSVVAMRNISYTDGPLMEHSPLIRGQPAILTVRRATPGETVYALGTTTGAGNSVGQPLLGGITLDLLEPIHVLGSALADANGRAVLEFNIPPNAPLTTVVMQAVIRRGPGGVDSVKTPFRTARILP